MTRLYAPSIVLTAWALFWTAGLRGDLVIVLGLLFTAAAVVIHANEYWENHAGP